MLSIHGFSIEILSDEKYLWGLICFPCWPVVSIKKIIHTNQLDMNESFPKPRKRFLINSNCCTWLIFKGPATQPESDVGSANLFPFFFTYIDKKNPFGAEVPNSWCYDSALHSYHSLQNSEPNPPSFSMRASEISKWSWILKDNEQVFEKKRSKF